MKKTLILSCALALASLSNVAFAAEGAGAFVRAEIGESNVDVSLADDNDTAYNVRGGYFFNKHFAAEAFYGSLYDNDGLELTAGGVGVVGKVYLNDESKFFAEGRLGAARLRGEVGGFSESNTKAYFGAGVGYDFNENFGVSLNAALYQADFGGMNVDAKTITVAGEYRF